MVLFQNKSFNLKKMLSEFYATPNESLHLTNFEDIVEALVINLKNQPEQLQVELLRFMVKYISFKGDYLILDYLNLISDE